MRNFFKL